jgi:outer membrane protein OmpA-like peptidoglycan-associated protein
MKNSKLLVIALAAALAFVVGCQSPKPRVTQLGDGSYARDSVHKDGNLNTNPLSAQPGAEGVTGGNLAGGDLPDDRNLADRDFDRSAFANETVYFDFDQANVKAAEASKLDQVAGAFKARGAGFDLLIEGHCDERGTEEYNRSLGERRALAIRELLMNAGIEGQHIFTRSFGKDKPAVASHDEAAWSKNRRGEFILVLPKKYLTTQNTQ